MRSSRCSKRSRGRRASWSSGLLSTSASRARAMPAGRPPPCHAPNSKPALPSCVSGWQNERNKYGQEANPPCLNPSFRRLSAMAKKNTPVAPTIPLDLWRELYQAAASFQLLAPWQWMDDTHVFGINNDHGVRLVAVLGSMGEIFRLASYRERR